MAHVWILLDDSPIKNTLIFHRYGLYSITRGYASCLKELQPLMWCFFGLCRRVYHYINLIPMDQYGYLLVEDGWIADPLRFPSMGRESSICRWIFHQASSGISHWWNPPCPISKSTDSPLLQLSSSASSQMHYERAERQLLAANMERQRHWTNEGCHFWPSMGFIMANIYFMMVNNWLIMVNNWWIMVNN